MSFIDRIFRSGNPFDNPGYPMTEMNVNAFLANFGGQHRSDSGEIVNPHTALQTSTVWACVQLISSQIAINPLFMFQLDAKGIKTLAVDHDYFDFVTNRPNPEQDAIQFRTAVQIDLLLHGNGYIELQRDNGGRVVAMWHRMASQTEPVRRDDKKLWFRTTDSVDREPRFIKSADMIHIMGNTLNGYIGLSPIEFAMQSIGGKLAMDKFGNRFFANNATPQMALMTKKLVKADEKTRMRQDWETLQSGHNQHRVAVLDGELDIKSISIPNDQAQFLESRNASEQEIAAIFGVPGHAIGLLEKSVKANVEQQATDLVNYCLRPWMAKWEKALTNKLFSTVGRSAGRYVVKFDTRELLRPDTSSRQAYYQSMIQNGVLSQNEVRDLEGYNPIPGTDGDGYYIQLNMQSLALANSTDPTPNGPDPELTQELEENSFPRRLGQNYRGLFKDGVQRVIKLNTKDSKGVSRCLKPTIDALSLAVRANVSTSTTSKVEYLQAELSPDDEGYKAIEKLLEGMQRRSKDWTEQDIEKICDEELRRVQRALIFALQRDIANAKAKLILEQLEADETEQEEE